MLLPMTFLKVTRAVAPALGVGLIASACSGKPAEAQAFVSLTMSQGTNSGLCPAYPSAHTIMAVGQPGMPNSTPPTQPSRVTTGAQTVEISCSVHPQGSSFAISLQITQGNVAGNGSSSLTVTGTVDPSIGGTNVTGDVFTSSNVGDFSSTACLITFDTPMAGASPAGAPVAGGRIWAHLSCPAVQDQAVMVQSGTIMTPATCDAEADFIFENCGT
jgi:hypothetical protein